MPEVFNPRGGLDTDSKDLRDAATAFHDVIQHGLKAHGKIHYETAIAAAAFMAGTTLLRGSGASFSGKQPGDPIAEPKVDAGAVHLIEFMQGLCAEATIGRDGGWLDPIPKEHRPKKRMGELISEFEPKFRGILQAFTITDSRKTKVAAMAAVQFIREGRSELHADIGKALAATSLVKAAKTVPPEPKAAVAFTADLSPSLG